MVVPSTPFTAVQTASILDTSSMIMQSVTVSTFIARVAAGALCAVKKPITHSLSHTAFACIMTTTTNHYDDDDDITRNLS